MLIDAIKNYFKKKTENQNFNEVPEGICPNCWGKQEWEGHFYEKIKTQKITPTSKTYDNFISEVVRKLDKITVDKDTYLCKTCNMKAN